MQLIQMKKQIDKDECYLFFCYQTLSISDIESADPNRSLSIINPIDIYRGAGLGY